MKIALSVALVTCAGLASAANAGISVTTGLTDAEADALGGGLYVWEAEGRFGDRGGAAERELGIGESTALPPADEAQVDWANNFMPPAGFNGYSYTINWDGTDTVTLDVTGIDASGDAVIENLVYILPGAESITDLYIRAAGNDVSLSSISWDLDGLMGSQAAGFGDDPTTVRFSGSQLTDGFTLSGEFTFAWADGAGTSNSRPAWQIKAAVPSPGAAMIFGMAGVLTLRRRR